MKRFSEKVFLQLQMPTEELPLSDQQRIRLALETLGYAPVTIPLSVLRQLYPLCRDSNFDITVTMVYRETDWVVTAVEAGNTTAHHYGLAVDYGSTTILMELVDLRSGAVIDRAKLVNGQTPAMTGMCRCPMRSRNLKSESTAKTGCVIINSAPASTFSQVRRYSRSKSMALGSAPTPITAEVGWEMG